MMPDKSMYPNKRIKMRKHASTYGDMSMVTPLVNVMSFKNNEISLKHNKQKRHCILCFIKQV